MQRIATILMGGVVLFSGVNASAPFESRLTFDAYPVTWTVQKDDVEIVYYLPCKVQGSATLPVVPPKPGPRIVYIQMVDIIITGFTCAGRELK